MGVEARWRQSLLQHLQEHHRVRVPPRRVFTRVHVPLLALLVPEGRKVHWHFVLPMFLLDSLPSCPCPVSPLRPWLTVFVSPCENLDSVWRLVSRTENTFVLVFNLLLGYSESTLSTRLQTLSDLLVPSKTIWVVLLRKFVDVFRKFRRKNSNNEIFLNTLYKSP